MLHPVPKLKETPSQTAGPYVHIGLTPNFAEIGGIYAQDLGVTMRAPDTSGEPILVTGRITDGAGNPVADAVVECWQANADGLYGAEGFTGWGRQPVDADGVYRFETIKPGAVRGPDGKPMAPHLALWIVARGINIGLQTRYYFGDEAEANAKDFVLNRIPDPKRRATLIARKAEDEPVPTYRLDICLQGDNETVFFDV